LLLAAINLLFRAALRGRSDAQGHHRRRKEKIEAIGALDKLLARAGQVIA
jgi:hypothetical protein